MHLNAAGMQDYCQRYGENIFNVCQTQEPPRPLSGSTLDTIRKAMEESISLEQLEEKRKWRSRRLAALAIHKMNMQKQDSTD